MEERLSLPRAGRSEFAKKVTPLLQRRVETLLIAVLRELLDRGRKVRVTHLSAYNWSRPVRSAGCLDNSDWGQLDAVVDGLRVNFDWLPVRAKEAREYAQDRLWIRWARDRDGTFKRGSWHPTPDCVRMVEPKADDFDPREVTEAFERWLVDRKREAREAMDRKATEERRQQLQKALEAEAVAALPHMLGASGVTATVSTRGSVALHVHWNNMTPTEARALMAALQTAHATREEQATAAAFALPE